MSDDLIITKFENIINRGEESLTKNEYEELCDSIATIITYLAKIQTYEQKQ